MDIKDLIFRYKQHIRQTIKLAVPVSLGQLGHVLIGVIDSVMVGKLGTDPLAAVSLVHGLLMLILVIGIGMSFAVTSLVAFAKGSDRNEECGIILNNSIVVNTLFSILLILVIFGMAEILEVLDQPQGVIREARSYLRIMGLSILPFMIFQTYRQYAEGLSFVNPPMVVTIIAVFVNGFLNWILIYGNLGFPALGLDGAGWASVITRFLMAMALFYYIMKSKLFKEYLTPFSFKTLERKIVRKLVDLGIPSGFQYFLEVAAFSFSAIMIGWLGSVQLAAHQIAINLASASYMIILGISSAANIRVSNAYGERSVTKIRRAGFSAAGVAVLFMAIAATVFISLRTFLPSLYIDSQEVISLASVLLIVAALFQLSDGLQATYLGILRGLMDVKIPMVFTFLAYWILGIPAGYLLSFTFNLGAVGVWIGLLIGLTSIAIFLMVRFNKKSRSVL